MQNGSLLAERSLLQGQRYSYHRAEIREGTGRGGKGRGPTLTAQIRNAHVPELSVTLNLRSFTLSDGKPDKEEHP